MNEREQKLEAIFLCLRDFQWVLVGGKAGIDEDSLRFQAELVLREVEQVERKREFAV